MSTRLQGLRESIRTWLTDPDHATTRKRIGVALALIVVLALVILALRLVWIVPQWEVTRSMDAALQASREKQLTLENEFRKTLTQIVLSIFGLFILYFTWQRARTGDKTVQIMEQGHITDRYTKAIEQLGKLDNNKPNIEVRLGAIYALERIARDSPRDHWTIMEVLTAYVRQNAPITPEAANPENPPTEKPRTDIQAILTVLGRRLISPKRESSDQHLDLSHAHLAGAYLENAHLQRADLANADLQGATLGGARLQAARLKGANLQGANLVLAELQGAILVGANLQDANLAFAGLPFANLSGANLQGADLAYAKLFSATLDSANLQRADLNYADLRFASFTNANLQEVNLQKANLQNAKLQDATNLPPALRPDLGLPPQETTDKTN
jgi:uncharacterized protein YjbI with pentapeptide repeats